jgi:hypothetical protein
MIELRQQLIESGDLTGSEWKAQIVNRTQERLDCSAVIAHLANQGCSRSSKCWRSTRSISSAERSEIASVRAIVDRVTG